MDRSVTERGAGLTAQSYDELRDLNGGSRPHWQLFLEHLETLGNAELSQRWQTAQHQLSENGVTYNVYGDPQGLERPWQLSPLPVLLDPDTWSELSRGLMQRAELANALLGDLYGEQRTL